MKRLHLVWRSLTQRWRMHLGLGAGIAITCGVITGALLIGAAVRTSLAEQAQRRLGRTTHALDAGDRQVRAALAPALAQRLDGDAAAIWRTRGSVLRTHDQRAANQVQILGVDDAFWRLGGTTSPGAVTANRTLADALGLQPGDELVVRLEKPSFLPRDAALSATADAYATLRLKLDAIIAGPQFGDFQLAANQLAPANLMIPRELLTAELDRHRTANLLLLASPLDDDATAAALRAEFTLADSGLQVRALPYQNAVEVRTSRVFLPAPVVTALTSRPDATTLLTWFVNGIARADRLTPYSMVVASSRWAELGDDEIVLSEWCAKDLLTRVGDSVTLTYFVSTDDNRLEERRATFRVARIITMDDPTIDREMMPAFPGLHDADSCREWDTAIPLELDRIRPQDEQYWRENRGLPKAVISLTAGRRLWANRYGDTTAVRLPLELGLEQRLSTELPATLGPDALGLRLLPVAAIGAAAWRQGLDFSGLFLGFSFFLVVAALLLTALLFTFALHHRRDELGTLSALGFARLPLGGLLLLEALAVALPGAAVGAGLGIVYAAAVLAGLQRVWQGAVGAWPIQFTLAGGPLAAGLAGGVGICLAVVAVAVWRALRQPPHELLTGARETPLAAGGPALPWRLAAWGCLGLGVALALVSLGASPERQAGLFFGVGGLLLAGGLLTLDDWLRRLAVAPSARQVGLAPLARRNLARRRARSVAVAAMLACGSFLVLALESQRLHAHHGADQRASGTGGFALVGTSTQGIYRDLNTTAGREHYDLYDDELPDFALLAFRVRDGDDASCLNLNRPQQPRLLAGSAAALAQRQAFTFVRHAPLPSPTASPWELLRADLGPDVLPAIGDEASIVYGLGRRIGDTLDYTDEQGRPLRVKLVASLANSILRGALIVDEAAYLRHYPSSAGYRFFLLEATPADTSVVAAALTQALGLAGLDLQPATALLAAYNQVQNTYISIFQVLGGLGLILGSAGLGLLVWHHVLERRRELALLRAVGFSADTLRRMLTLEHAWLLGAGLLIGIVAALVAVIPVWRLPGATMPWFSLATLLAILVASGLLWIVLAAHWAVRGSVLAALRRE